MAETKKEEKGWGATEKKMLYLHFKCNGNYADISEELKKGTKAPDDKTLIEVLKRRFKAADDKLGGDIEHNFYFLHTTDGSYPKEISKLAFAPFVIECKGDLSDLKARSCLWLESADFLNMMSGLDIPSCYVEKSVGVSKKSLKDEDNVEGPDSCLVICTPFRSPKTGEMTFKKSYFFEDYEYAMVRASQMAKMALADKGDTNFADLCMRIPKKNLFAVPGNSGCATNRLIKGGWNLCDCAEDLKDALERIKKEEIDKKSLTGKGGDDGEVASKSIEKRLEITGAKDVVIKKAAGSGVYTVIVDGESVGGAASEEDAKGMIDMLIDNLDAGKILDRETVHGAVSKARSKLGA